MAEPIEFQGLRALEYAAQTGAQLVWRRGTTDPDAPISTRAALTLWSFGAEAQIFCAMIDHQALAATAGRIEA
jgi:hypothetical protein